MIGNYGCYGIIPEQDADETLSDYIDCCRPYGLQRNR
jgi:hypothetical protein